MCVASTRPPFSSCLSGVVLSPRLLVCFCLFCSPSFETNKIARPLLVYFFRAGGALRPFAVLRLWGVRLLLCDTRAVRSLSDVVRIVRVVHICGGAYGIASTRGGRSHTGGAFVCVSVLSTPAPVVLFLLLVSVSLHTAGASVLHRPGRANNTGQKERRGRVLLCFASCRGGWFLVRYHTGGGALLRLCVSCSVVVVDKHRRQASVGILYRFDTARWCSSSPRAGAIFSASLLLAGVRSLRMV